MDFTKSMDDFFDSIEEAFNNPLEIRWIDKTNIIIGLFHVNNRVFQINCENKNNNFWKYDFYLMDKDKNLSPELTGLDKDKYRVMPTVKKGFYYLYDNKNPDAIIFGAGDKSRGRKKLYESFAQEFALEKNYIFYTKMFNNKQVFILYKEHADKKLLYNTLIEIIEN